jgi:hypothetical protein
MRKDYTGMKFGNLTVIKCLGKHNNGKEVLWELMCVCGKVVEYPPCKAPNSCGCLGKRSPKGINMKDYTGLKFGKLTYLSRTDIQNSADQYKWKAECECGKEVLVIPNHGKSCGECIKGYTANRKWEPVISTARYVWHQRYSDGGISFEEFYDLSQKDCYYCGRKPSNTYTIKRNRKLSTYQKENGVFVYNGLDRIDSNLGHTLANVVPCCKICNQAKNNLSKEEFFEMIKCIYEKHILIDTRNQTNDYEI